MYVVNGELIRGYKIEGLGSFAYYDGTFHFAGKDDAEDEQRKAAEHGGWGFQGYTLIHEHETLSVPVHKYRCFRALAETDGKLAIIESKKHMYLKDFCESMQKLGVSNAIYLDMGSLSYSWYRDNTGEAKTLIGFPQPFSHNWLVFRK